MMFAAREPSESGAGMMAGVSITNNNNIATNDLHAVGPTFLPRHHNGTTGNPAPRNNNDVNNGSGIAESNDHGNNTTIPAMGTETWKETAWDWYQRSRRRSQRPGQLRRRVAQPRTPPTNPFEAAWDFWQPVVPCATDETFTVGGTGIAVVDAALAMPVSSKRRRQPLKGQQQPASLLPTPAPLPVLEISGDRQTGKTWTLICLAARYVAATLPSRYSAAAEPPNPLQEIGTTATATNQLAAPTPNKMSQQRCLPHVILLDASLDVTISKLAFAVVSTLLRTNTSDSNNPRNSDPTQLERDIECCLHRIHICHADHLAGWVPFLESIRCQLLQQQQQGKGNGASAGNQAGDSATSNTSPRAMMNQALPPTLLLWDGFLSEPSDSPTRTEVTRQLVRLVQDVPTVVPVLVGNSTFSSSSSMGNSSDWDQLVTHRIRLQRNPDASSSGHGFVGQVATGSTAASSTATCWSEGTTQVPYSLSTTGVLS